MNAEEVLHLTEILDKHGILELERTNIRGYGSGAHILSHKKFVGKEVIVLILK